MAFEPIKKAVINRKKQLIHELDAYYSKQEETIKGNMKTCRERIEAKEAVSVHFNP